MSGRILDTQATGVQTPSTQNIMLWVMVALIPGTLASAMLISSMVLVNVVCAITFSMVIEACALSLRRENISQGIQDGSIALAAALLALAVPPMLPLWQLLVGVFIMVALGKQVYGGLGNNPFNPAMVGYAALLVSFPQNMTLWFIPEALQQVNTADLIKAKLSLSLLEPNSPIAWDGMTRATPLEHVRTLRLQSQQLQPQQSEQLFRRSAWLWVNTAFLIGGLFLVYRRIIQWHIPVAVLAGFIICATLFSSGAISLPASVFSGALILGAFFIATDPVTAASSKRGRLIFGFGIGVLTFVIREYGGYPEGLAFAVLLMNLCVPLIDHLDIQLAKQA